MHKKMIRGRQQNALEMWKEKWRQKFIHFTDRLEYVQKLPTPWGMQYKLFILPWEMQYKLLTLYTLTSYILYPVI
jgi:hypothetical protein